MESCTAYSILERFQIFLSYTLHFFLFFCDCITLFLVVIFIIGLVDDPSSMIFAYAFWYLLGSFGRRALLGIGPSLITERENTHISLHYRGSRGCQMHFHRVSELQEFRHSFSREGSLRSQGIHPRIQGDHVDPRWMDEKPACSLFATASDS
ncbi:hypothetical protein V8E55_009159 [Tylopilus felleus]